MIDDDGRTPILMDLGSIAPSPINITSRSQAIAVQDEAGEHSTMPYRAPELWDVKTDAIIDDKVDIWSLGCTVYACLVGKSPFESRSDETGGSLGMCIMGGDWRFPDEGQQKATGRSAGGGPAAAAAPTEDVISDAVKDVVRKCLTLEPSERPNVDELMTLLEQVIQTLPDDASGD
jgi:serine/threonine kinase 16